MKNFILGAMVALLVATSSLGGAVLDRVYRWGFLDKYVPRSAGSQGETRVVSEDDNLSGMLENVGPAVVTVAVRGTRPDRVYFDWNSMGVKQEKGESFQQDIGSGFIVDANNGLVVTNRHVVGQEGVEYKVITIEGTEYKVQNIYRDQVNDMAILKIDPKENQNKKLTEVAMGDSDKLKVGQKAVAIGTALGEFRNTVTTGVISGLGRGISATDVFAGVVEKIDGLIQTDAAINPGNSGGPLLDTYGNVIGVNTAVAGDAQGLGFALPINVIKEVLNNFNKTGQFERAYFGVKYKMIDKQTAVMNDLPQGAYVAEVVKDSPAEKGGVKTEDVITKFGGEKVTDAKGGLGELVSKHKKGEVIVVELWRDKEAKTLSITLEASK